MKSALFGSTRFYFLSEHEVLSDGHIYGAYGHFVSWFYVIKPDRTGFRLYRQRCDKEPYNWTNSFATENEAFNAAHEDMVKQGY